MAKTKKRILKGLDDEQLAQLDSWLVDEGAVYEVVVERLESQFGFKTSVAALSRYYTEELWEVTNEKAADFAERVVAAAAAHPDKYDEATLAAIKKRAFQMAVVEHGDVKDLAILAGILGDSRKQATKEKEVALHERRVALLEKKAAQADAAAAITGDETLTPEEKEARYRQVFGLS